MTTGPSHYEVLGCRTDATAAELRRAYVNLARVHHPDYHGNELAHQRRDAESAMQRLNAAWHVLGDVSRRQAYDVTLVTRGFASGHGASGERRDDAWRPLDDDYDLDDYGYDDAPIEGSRPLPALLAVAPVLLLLVAAVLLGAALLADLRLLVVASAIVACSGIAGFVIVPLVALTRSQRATGSIQKAR